ncbi:DUF551 domain-containing protein [Eisenbergiella tayi]|uniref:DUF551 domain-containing protein n=1 Tax=Eisenbergiella tayi TaxID=1432052 RepID=UPI0008494214|nr:DUF551 domain-containing protein [Eisenbergiella tayi]ODR35484.1 hypothetical protein BEI60_16275 [Eisenbergiella tayi]
MERFTEWNGEQWIPVQKRINGGYPGNKACMGRLAAYEDTGLTPEEIMDGQLLTGWIPVEERMPESEKEVYIQTARGTVTTAIYEDGKVSEDDSCWNWTDIDFNYDEVTDINYVPEGWWEYRHFNPDDVYNNIVDEAVIAWMPLPKPYKIK